MAKLKFGPEWLRSNLKNDLSENPCDENDNMGQHFNEPNTVRDHLTDENNAVCAWSGPSFSSIVRGKQSSLNKAETSGKNSDKGILIERNYRDRMSGHRSSNIRLIDSSKPIQNAENEATPSIANVETLKSEKNSRDMESAHSVHTYHTIQTLVRNSSGAYYWQTQKQTHEVYNEDNVDRIFLTLEDSWKCKNKNSPTLEFVPQIEEDLNNQTLQFSTLSPYAKPFEFKKSRVVKPTDDSNTNYFRTWSNDENENRRKYQYKLSIEAKPFTPKNAANDNEVSESSQSNEGSNFESTSLSRRKFLSGLSANAEPFDFKKPKADKAFVGNEVCKNPFKKSEQLLAAIVASNWSTGECSSNQKISGESKLENAGGTAYSDHGLAMNEEDDAEAIFSKLQEETNPFLQKQWTEFCNKSKNNLSVKENERISTRLEVDSDKQDFKICHPKTCNKKLDDKGAVICSERNKNLPDSKTYFVNDMNSETMRKVASSHPQFQVNFKTKQTSVEKVFESEVTKNQGNRISLKRFLENSMNSTSNEENISPEAVAAASSHQSIEHSKEVHHRTQSASQLIKIDLNDVKKSTSQPVSCEMRTKDASASSHRAKTSSKDLRDELRRRQEASSLIYPPGFVFRRTNLNRESTLLTKLNSNTSDTKDQSVALSSNQISHNDHKTAGKKFDLLRLSNDKPPVPPRTSFTSSDEEIRKKLQSFLRPSSRKSDSNIHVTAPEQRKLPELPVRPKKEHIQQPPTPPPRRNIKMQLPKMESCSLENFKSLLNNVNNSYPSMKYIPESTDTSTRPLPVPPPLPSRRNIKLSSSASNDLSVSTKSLSVPPVSSSVNDVLSVPAKSLSTTPVLTNLRKSCDKLAPNRNTFIFNQPDIVLQDAKSNSDPNQDNFEISRQFTNNSRNLNVYADADKKHSPDRSELNCSASTNPFLSDYTPPPPVVAVSHVITTESSCIRSAEKIVNFVNSNLQTLVVSKPENGNPFLDDDVDDNYDDNNDYLNETNSTSTMESNPEQNLWFYIDPNCRVQGPFSNFEMAEWHSLGYFNESLAVRRHFDDQFVTLGELVYFTGSCMPFLEPHLLPPSFDVLQNRQVNETNQLVNGY